MSEKNDKELYLNFDEYIRQNHGIRITGRFFDPLKMAESITDSRIYGFTEIRTE